MREHIQDAAVTTSAGLAVSITAILSDPQVSQALTVILSTLLSALVGILVTLAKRQLRKWGVDLDGNEVSTAKARITPDGAVTSSRADAEGVERSSIEDGESVSRVRTTPLPPRKTG